MFILCDAIIYGIILKNNEIDRVSQHIVYVLE